jgi:uncharacterized coiled-coil protein SlyX
MSNIGGWFRDNQALALALAAQAIVAGIYMVNLEARVNTLEIRGSPHLEKIDARLTVLEAQTKENKERLERIVDVMTKKLNVNP